MLISLPHKNILALHPQKFSCSTQIKIPALSSKKKLLPYLKKILDLSPQNLYPTQKKVFDLPHKNSCPTAKVILPLLKKS